MCHITTVQSTNLQITNYKYKYRVHTLFIKIIFTPPVICDGMCGTHDIHTFEMCMCTTHTYICTEKYAPFFAFFGHPESINKE